jgi:hypothetical protein
MWGYIERSGVWERGGGREGGMEGEDLRGGGGILEIFLIFLIHLSGSRPGGGEIDASGELVREIGRTYDVACVQSWRHLLYLHDADCSFQTSVNLTHDPWTRIVMNSDGLGYTRMDSDQHRDEKC